MSNNVLNPIHFAKSVSLGATYTSPAMLISYQDNIALILSWTGVPVGAFTIQVSLDYTQSPSGAVTNAGIWATIPTISVNGGGSPGSGYISLNQVGAPWIRVVFTSISGTGILDGFISGKGV